MIKKSLIIIVCAAFMLCIASAGYLSGSISLQTELTDVSEFVVGTFEEADGSMWHFDGTSEVKISRDDDVTYGYYHFLEDTSGDAVMLMGMGSTTEVYKFDLDSSEGSFSLSAKGVDYSFDPVHIQ